MLELPLFPLQTVLFPGVPLLLHIFEERYQQMIQLCLQTHQPFGVVLIRRGVEALGPLAEPHRVGCTARITRVESLAEGRMNISTLGEERFRVLSMQSETSPYWVGNVEPFPLVNPKPLEFNRAVKGLRPIVLRYLQLLEETGKIHVNREQLPENALAFAYVASSLLQITLDAKQELLSIEYALLLADRLRIIYLRESALMRTMLDHSGRETKPFSEN